MNGKWTLYGAVLGCAAAATIARGQPCEQPATHCQNAFREAIQLSIPEGPIHADDFSPAETGNLTGLCWHGLYATPFGACSSVPTDDFRVRYFESVNGLPAGVIAEFSQSGGTLTMLANVPTGRTIFGLAPEYRHAATHAPVAVQAGACYWIEISNRVDGGGNFCNWHWMHTSSGDGECLQDGSFGPPNGYTNEDILFGDMAFCLSLPLGPSGQCLPPRAPNETCQGALPLECGQTRTTNNSVRQPFDMNLPFTYGCGGWSTHGLLNSMWYTFVPSSDSAVIEVNGAFGLDSVVAVYAGTCGAFSEVGCNDDHSPIADFSRAVLRNLTPGQTYYVMLASYPFTFGGEYTITATCPAPDAPANDTCGAAQIVTTGTTVNATNENATEDIEALGQCFAATGPIRGVWYRVTGDGSTLTASTCFSSPMIDTELRVFCGNCEPMQCVASSNNDCDIFAQVSWCTQFGADYLVLVSAANGNAGPFELALTSDGTPCVDALPCLPNGSCCVGTSCSIVTQPRCAADGGLFRGADTLCGSYSYIQVPGGAPFEDISVTGQAVTFTELPLPFAFPFWDTVVNHVDVVRHGFLELTPATPSTSSPPSFPGPIPSQDEPNGIVAALMTSLNITAPGAGLFYETRGDAPNRRFIVQWHRVRRTTTSPQLTFQAALFEGSGEVELRYSVTEPQPTSRQFRAGIEDPTGLLGLEVPSEDIAPGTVYRLIPRLPVNPCVCRADFNESGAVSVQDIFDFLATYFAGAPLGDFNGVGGVTVQDIFDFLATYFTGCP